MSRVKEDGTRYLAMQRHPQKVHVATSMIVFIYHIVMVILRLLITFYYLATVKDLYVFL